MPRAACLIRPLPQFRRDAFVAGLEANGYGVTFECQRTSSRDDVLVIWNRSRVNAKFAERYEQAGARVIVAENGYLGREWLGSCWYALARDNHNGAGQWPNGAAARWESLAVALQPWRSAGEDIVVLAQRGIGAVEYRSPAGWTETTALALALRTSRRVRVRAHPGEKPPAVSLQDDLRNAWACVTWGSGAALKALLLGVPVFYQCPSWIGAAAARPLAESLDDPFLGDRLPMFRRLAWAMASVEEIATGEPFRCLLELPST